jgi:transcriptional regulator with XRE-family HTH domain
MPAKRLPYLSRQITILREARGWTRYRLAKEAGLIPSTVERIEAGLRPNPQWDTVLAIARAFGISLDDFRENPVSST